MIRNSMAGQNWRLSASWWLKWMKPWLFMLLRTQGSRLWLSPICQRGVGQDMWVLSSQNANETWDNKNTRISAAVEGRNLDGTKSNPLSRQGLFGAVGARYVIDSMCTWERNLAMNITCQISCQWAILTIPKVRLLFCGSYKPASLVWRHEHKRGQCIRPVSELPVKLSWSGGFYENCGSRIWGQQL